MINTKRNIRLETYRGDTGLLSIYVAGYNFADGDCSILSVIKGFVDATVDDIANPHLESGLLKEKIVKDICGEQFAHKGF